MVRKALFRLWSLYFDAASWEADGRLYERLGVRRASRLLLNGYYMNAALGRLRGRRYRVIRDRGSAYEWLLFTVVAELGHGFFGVAMIVTAVLQALDARWDRAAITTALNLVVNAYPIMVQRYNRARIARMLDLDAGKVLDLALWEKVVHPGPERPEASWLPCRSASPESSGYSGLVASPLTPQRNMTRTIAYWTCTVIASVMLLLALSYLTGSEEVVSGFEKAGYPQHLRIALGIAKPAAGIVLLLPGLRLLKEWAYAGCTITWIMAAISSYASGEQPGIWALPIGLLVLLGVSYATRPASRRLIPTILPQDPAMAPIR